MELTYDRAHELFYIQDNKLFWKLKADTKMRSCFNKRYANKEAGTFDGKGYRRVKCDQNMPTTGAHRIIFLMHHKYLPEIIDHINGNPSDNRIENLRAATRQTNNHNSVLARHNTSGVKGVSYSKQNKHWRCSLSFNNKTKEVAGFKTIEDAADFMDLWRSEAHGKFANNGIRSAA
jgi:HNH endonuclease